MGRSIKSVVVGELKEWFRYDPETGNIYRKKYPPAAGKRTPVGQPVGTVKSTGYIHIGFMYVSIPAHRLAWALYYGEWPKAIDHINGIVTDNRIVNLREVTVQGNGTNRKLNKNSSSGTSGVYFNSRARRWRAHIKYFGENIHLGYFDNLEDAVAARKEAELRYGYLKAHDQLKTGQAQCQI